MEPAPPVPPPPPPAPPVDDRCYRHPEVSTGVHCTRCGRPICTDCMHPAPVGHQCPECAKGGRQEIRRPGRQVTTGPSGGVSVTNVLLGILVVAYLAEVAIAGFDRLISGPGALSLLRAGGDVALALLPTDEIVGVATGQYWRLFTSMFLHAGLIHLAMNGYALYLFGNLIETEEGWPRLLAIYIVTGLCASAASYAFNVPTAVGVGASGAIFGLFGMFLGTAWVRRDLAFYAARVRSAMTMIALNLLITFAVPAIDWRAHVGGLVAGVVIGAVAGSRRTRAVPFALACVGLLAVALALVVWRTADLRATFPELF